MSANNFVFDINDVTFDECLTSDEYETVTLYFEAPKQWLQDEYPEAVHCEISVEYPTRHPEAFFASVMISPTEVDERGNAFDNDWRDFTLTYSEIEQLLNLAKKYKK